MSRRDIMPDHNRDTIETRDIRLNASETFVLGEPVSVNADGELTESADDPVDGDVIGVAAHDADTGATNGLSDINNRFAQYSHTGIITTGGLVQVWLSSPLASWRTPNVSIGGTTFGDSAMALADLLGERGGLTLTTGVWGFDLVVTNFTCRCIDVYNARGQSLQLAGGTGVYITFAIAATQLFNFGALDAAVA